MANFCYWFSNNILSFQHRRLRQSASSFTDNYSRGRLNNFPTHQKTQTILYPGSAGALPEYEEEEYEEEPVMPEFALPVLTPTTTTTTTTPYPIVTETRRTASRRPINPVTPIAPFVPLVTPSAPVATIRSPARASSRRRRPQSKVVESRLETVTEDNEPLTEDEEERLFREEQARNAHYTFGTSIDDTINDHSIHRQETREGLALKGMYSYSDGFYKRTIHYEADENGYRVVK